MLYTSNAIYRDLNSALRSLLDERILPNPRGQTGDGYPEGLDFWRCFSDLFWTWFFKVKVVDSVGNWSLGRCNFWSFVSQASGRNFISVVPPAVRGCPITMTWRPLWISVYTKYILWSSNLHQRLYSRSQSQQDSGKYLFQQLQGYSDSTLDYGLASGCNEDWGKLDMSSISNIPWWSRH